MSQLSKYAGYTFDINVREVLDQLEIPYRESGRDFVIRCISGSHIDRRPSLRISKETGVFHCPVCHFKGNMITLVSKMTGVDTKQALDKLKVAKTQFFDEYSQALKIKKKVTVIKKDPAITLPPAFLKIQSQHEMFLKYLYGRKVTDNMIQYFDIRCCLIGYFNYRVIIPFVFDKKVVCYQARDILKEEERFERGEERYSKILTSPGTNIGHFLFNYDYLNKFQELYLVEGVFDALSLYSEGIKNVTCVSGCHITDEQARLLIKFKDIVVVPDQKGGNPESLTDVTKKKIGSYCNIKEVILPQGEDPGSVPEILPYIKQAKEIVIESKYKVIEPQYVINK